jgi:hypothetical protein
MLAKETMKGFRTWKDQTLVKKEQSKFNKNKGSSILIEKFKKMLFIS